MDAGAVVDAAREPPPRVEGGLSIGASADCGSAGSWSEEWRGSILGEQPARYRRVVPKRIRGFIANKTLRVGSIPMLQIAVMRSNGRLSLCDRI
jgi:hypothetical protein